MENTSKALLIAAAVLISIIVITVAIKIISSPKESVESAEKVGKQSQNKYLMQTYHLTGIK